MLEVAHAVVRFGDRVVVDDVDLTVADGETLAVLGPSGCGKTTLLRAVAGLQALDGGTVTWDGRDVCRVPPHERGFGFMFQEYALFPHRDVAGNVEFGLRMHGVDKATRRERVDEVLDLVGLGALRTREVATLSGGEQQRVALARALAVEPRLLMLDEPLGALDREWRARLVVEIRALLAIADLSAVYVTHDHEEAFALADRVMVMRAGRVVQVAPPLDIWRRPADAWTAGFLGFGGGVPARVDGGVVATPWGDVPAPPTTVAGPATLVLRPDAVRMDADGQIRASVLRTRFAGAHVDVITKPECGPELAVSVSTREAPAPGARVVLTLDPDALLMYPPD